VFDVPTDLSQTLLTQWNDWNDESLEVPDKLPALLQKDRSSDQHSGFGGRGDGWRNQFRRGGSRNGSPRDFNRNGMPKRRASWNTGAAQNRRKTFN